MMSRLKLLSLLFLVAASANGLSQSTQSNEIPLGKSFKSPDGIFSAYLSDSDGTLSIKNNKTGDVDQPQKVLLPLFSLKWTGDSKTICTVEHIANGTIFSLLHFENGKWKLSTVEPPNNSPGACMVLKTQIGLKTVTVTYKIMDFKTETSAPKFSVCTFEVDPDSKAISNIVTKSIDIDAYRNLKYEDTE